jgi:hypothetical protein
VKLDEGIWKGKLVLLNRWRQELVFSKEREWKRMEVYDKNNKDKIKENIILIAN